MDEQLALLLSPIIHAYRPHTPIPTKEELDDERVAKSYVSMESICGQLNIRVSKAKYRNKVRKAT